ncbi:MAG: type-F conjugative transfer system secretin TraK [Waddliaceae bacterium]
MIRKDTSCFFLIFLLAVSFSHAAVFHTLDTHRLIRCQFSSVSQNRIAVEEGRIMKVIFPESGLSVTLEEESGQVFVYVLTPMPRKTTLSVVTDSAVVQDIELDFSDMPSEVLVLRYPESCPKEKSFCRSDTCSDDVDGKVETLQNLLQGSIPCGYISCPVSRDVKRKIRKGLEATLVGKYAGEKKSLYLWQVRNSSIRAIKLSEEELNFQGGDWLYLDRSCIRPKAKTFFVVGVS